MPGHWVGMYAYYDAWGGDPMHHSKIPPSNLLLRSGGSQYRRYAFQHQFPGFLENCAKSVPNRIFDVVILSFGLHSSVSRFFIKLNLFLCQYPHRVDHFVFLLAPNHFKLSF
jgi:hypothetical protein